MKLTSLDIYTYAVFTFIATYSYQFMASIYRCVNFLMMLLHYLSIFNIQKALMLYCIK